MRSRMSLIAVAVLCAVCASVTGARQDEEPRPELSFIVVEHVQPSMMKEYEEATRELISELKAYQVDPAKVRFFTIVGPELGYAYVIPISSFAEFDGMKESWGSVVEQIGEQRWKTLAARADAAVERRESFFSRWRADLSYEPANPSLAEEDVKYIKYAMYYVKPGHEEQLEQVAKDYAALYREHGIDRPWNIYQAITGADLPLYVVANPAESPAAHENHKERIGALLAEAAAPLEQESMKHVRKIELMDGWWRPDLSYPSMDE
ncbi:MAG: hypothetical protein HKO59_17990 [Phycisphaerales bacterium]|nr:hypothetical protein [Phycisphaerae bacterium]NNF44672.1 hypothetical protein [Phycisphaerales bacterium]NNM27830.1 hypothetical protein [Phycisphaerales bacterium]